MLNKKEASLGIAVILTAATAASGLKGILVNYARKAADFIGYSNRPTITQYDSQNNSAQENTNSVQEQLEFDLGMARTLHSSRIDTKTIDDSFDKAGSDRSDTEKPIYEQLTFDDVLDGKVSSTEEPLVTLVWETELFVKANGYSDNTKIAVYSGSNKGDDVNDLADPPTYPTGVNVSGETADFSEVIRNAYGPDDLQVFPIFMEYNNLTPSNLELEVDSGLPAGRWFTRTFEDGLYTTRNGPDIEIQNGGTYSLPNDTQSAEIFEKPTITHVLANGSDMTATVEYHGPALLKAYSNNNLNADNWGLLDSKTTVDGQSSYSFSVNYGNQIFMKVEANQK